MTKFVEFTLAILEGRPVSGPVTSSGLLDTVTPITGSAAAPDRHLVSMLLSLGIGKLFENCHRYALTIMQYRASKLIRLSLLLHFFPAGFYTYNYFLNSDSLFTIHFTWKIQNLRTILKVMDQPDHVTKFL